MLRAMTPCPLAALAFALAENADWNKRERLLIRNYGQKIGEISEDSRTTAGNDG